MTRSTERRPSRPHRSGLPRWVVALALGLEALLGAPQWSYAKAKVDWASITVPEGERAARLQKLLKLALAKATKKADFGTSGSVKLAARVIELTTEERGDVVRVTCTLSGRVIGGQGARSRISYGGSPEKVRELEEEVINQVARGLVGRLAQMVRAKARK